MRRLGARRPQLGVAGIEEYIKSIGLFRTKAKNVFALSQMIIEKHCGAVPQNREALEELVETTTDTWTTRAPRGRKRPSRPDQ